MMGEIAEMIQDGLLCQVCGGAMEDIADWCDGGIHEDEVPGYPRTCELCKAEEE